MKFNFRKAINALVFFAEKEGGAINKMKALKLIWLSDRYHFRNNSRPIIGDTYFALKKGPIPSKTKDILNKYGLEDFELQDVDETFQFIKNDFRAIADCNRKVFSKTDIEIMDLVYEKYGKFNQFQISEMTHDFPEWKKFEQKLSENDENRYLIDYSLFFLTDLNNKSDLMPYNKEVVDLCSEIYKEVEIV